MAPSIAHANDNRRMKPISAPTKMFGDYRRKHVRARGEEGPVPVPHNERVQLKTLSDDPDLSATRSLLSLAAASSDSRRQQQNNVEMQSNFATTGSLHDAANVVASAQQQDDDTDEPAIRDSAMWGLAMEYAAGVALRTHVLEPTLSDFPNAPLDEMTRFLGMNSRGEFLLVCDGGSSDDGSVVQQASMERIRGQDGALLTKWWEDDRFLSFTDQEWSDWWVKRCHLFDPGCEMYKLVTNSGETLGVVYFERNIVDNHEFGDKGRISLVRGIRVAPNLNPEVARRRKLVSANRDENGAVFYKRISSLLFYHVLFMSVRYGANAVGVNCPKNLESERFYQSFMGPPIAFDESGRRYYRLGSQERWKVLRDAFHQQVELWLPQLGTPTGTLKNGSLM